MDGREFYRRVEEHPDLEWLGCKLGVSPEVDRVFVGSRRTKTIRFDVPPSAILDPQTTWEDLEPVLTGRRPPKSLSHLTRIVGYYSNLKAWNRSKKRELRDRQRGTYGVSPEAVDRPWPTGLHDLHPDAREEVNA